MKSKVNHIYLAMAVFFFIITAQAWWSTIHGDGAVYAWLIKEASEKGVSLLMWTRTEYFTDHPYLFFYWAAPFVKILGVNDLAVKLPNYIIGFVSLFMVYKMTFYRTQKSVAALLACYILICNPLYELMLRQPTLDPLAQLLSLISIYFLIYRRSFFISGLFMGLAFTTKGLELLPNLAALFVVACMLIYQNNLNPFKNILIGIVGTLMPVLIWLGYDYFFWNQGWLAHYLGKQIHSRFFGAENTQQLFSLAYLKNLISKYFIQLAILVWGTYRSLKQKKKLDLFWWYAILYSLLNIVAFSLIKKDSSQHLTGIFLFTSILIGPYLWTSNKKVEKFMPLVHSFILVAALSLWSYMWIKPNTKDDLWNFIKHQKNFFAQPENHLPIIVDPSVTDVQSIYFAGQWYWPSNSMHFVGEASSLKGQEVFILLGKDEKSFEIKKLIY